MAKLFAQSMDINCSKHTYLPVHAYIHIHTNKQLHVSAQVPVKCATLDQTADGGKLKHSSHHHNKYTNNTN